MRRWIGLAAVLCGALATLVVQGQQIHRNPFEGRRIAWQRGPADAPVTELEHKLTAQTAKGGQQCEHIRLTADRGSHVYYFYPVGRAELVEELTLSLWLKANRPGIQLFARLVMPKERDPKNLDAPMTLLLRGDVYQKQGRWQRLELLAPQKVAQQQLQLLRAELGRDVNADGAYVDQVVLNLYAGPGLVEVWIDELEIGPISGDPPFSAGTSGDAPRTTPSGQPTSLPAPRHAVVELNHDRLMVNKKPFFLRGIRYSDTPLKVLRDAGFNTLFVDASTKAEVLEEAVEMGFWLVPDLAMTDNAGGSVTPATLSQGVQRFPCSDAVLFWLLGSGLTAEQAEMVRQAASTIRAADVYQGRPVSADVWDGFRPYSRHLEMVGVHRWPLMTGLELNHYRDWLVGRARLLEGGVYTWTWIQTHLPEWYTQLVYRKSADEEFDEPIGPQPEQIRLLTYIALSAGYRGIGFWSDRFLANSHHGRDRLLQLALLNQELEMLEPMLATLRDTEVRWISSKQSEIKAAVLRYDGGVLVLPIWLGKGAQFVPGQLATNNLELVIPGAPADAQVWEISPGDVRAVPAERVAGGLKVVLPEFGLTTALVLTNDVNPVDGGQIGRLQQAARKTRRLAAQWSYDLAVEELAKVERINSLLELARQGQPDAQGLLAECRRRLDLARAAWSRGTDADYRVAYAEAQRALRPLRILMRAHWERAVGPLDSPVSSPYAVSFFTLPMHWQLAEDVRSLQPTVNLLEGGDFEKQDDAIRQHWTMQETSLDSVQSRAAIVADKAQQGKHCLKLEIKPQDRRQTPGALERTFLAVHTPAYPLQPGSLVRITGWVRIPEPIQASADGVLFYDSAGGEPLAVRLTDPTPWRRFTLYRRVPDSGFIHLTMALTGIGTVYFDDLRIEPMLSAQVPGQLVESAPVLPPALSKPIPAKVAGRSDR
ncbi:MAG: hypothetical protein NZM31_07920 [Gemmatales bacterium]|nr:hypothetical protein [Gemmatales bacterium]MDW8386919.1 hypothetical protein [Gemmatales bacterium]